VATKIYPSHPIFRRVHKILNLGKK
jgi:hypothetical protein